jgi:oxygen-dependent protoporphyrinogen oxidase
MPVEPLRVRMEGTSLMNADVIVVGAGLSGLVTAYRLHRAGLQVRVVEAAPRPGGVIRSERRDGILFEHGPNSGLDTSPTINALLDDLGIRDQRIDASKASARRYVVRNGTMVALPTSPGAFIATPLFSWRAKLRLLAEPFIPAQTGTEESIAQFVRRRLGREFLDYAIEPFVSGIYAGDPETLSVPAAFPRLHALERDYGGLIRGAVLGARERRRRGAPAKNAAVSFSFRGGLQGLTDALAQALPDVSCGTPVTAIARPDDGVYSVTVGGGGAPHRARAVVVATPAYAAASIVEPLAPEAAQALGAIPYAPVAVVVTAYRRRAVSHPLDGFGVLAPAAERPRILGSLFSSTMFEGRAPADLVLFTTFLGGRRRPELAAAPDTELLQSVQTELGRLAGVAEPPVLSEIARWPRAIPQYTLGHLQRIAAVEQAEQRLPGLHFCCNYRGGVSIGDCIVSGEAMAQTVMARLSPTRPVAPPGSAPAAG